jgi:hypothetical protein
MMLMMVFVMKADGVRWNLNKAPNVAVCVLVPTQPSEKSRNNKCSCNSLTDRYASFPNRHEWKQRNSLFPAPLTISSLSNLSVPCENATHLICGLCE